MFRCCSTIAHTRKFLLFPNSHTAYVEVEFSEDKHEPIRGSPLKDVVGVALSKPWYCSHHEMGEAVGLFSNVYVLSSWL